MGMFSVDENPEYCHIENQISIIRKIIEEYDFLSDTEKIVLIKEIINNKITGV